ncbi:GH25 family lysozyme [Phaeovulum sp.]|uniref:glycoside hydrolase family 25 protein n=1 Tax=Phaeovulum sp. TaxID=2934796 RepID=UPI0039E30C66
MRVLVRGIILSLLALALASCGGRDGPRSTRRGAIQHATGIPATFGDTAPHSWSGRAPVHYAVHGIDASRWQGQIDWPRAAASGVAFAWLKATEGGDVLDPGFDDNWRGARRAGVPVGAYHYYYFCRPAAEQARWFISHVPRAPGALPPVLDLEWNHRSKTCPLRPDAETIRSEARIFLSMLTAHYGQRPVIYTTVDFYKDAGLGQMAGQEFWLRSVAGHPATVYPGQHWTFWQYTGTGQVPGVATPVDINVFAGSPANWTAWLAARSQR